MKKKFDRNKKPFDPQPDRASTDEFLEAMVTLTELEGILKNQFSRATIYRWIADGMPSKKIGHRRWFHKYEVIDWLQRRFT